MKSINRTVSTYISNCLYTHRYNILLILILLLATFLRFYNYSYRFGLAADQARDLLIVREALRLHTLPLIGPFSASGPFIFGPYWYWVFMLPVLLFPSYFWAPWFFQGILYISIVVIIYYIGKELKNSKLGLLLSLFTAISPAEINLSTNLVTSSLIGFLAVVILCFFLQYIKNKSKMSLFIFTFLLGISINTHFEAIPLIFFLPLAIIFGKRSSTHMVLAFISFLIPFTPLLIFNTISHAFESTHVFHYLLSHPQTTPIPKRWLTSLTISWPQRWSEGIGGYSIIGGITMTSCFLYGGYRFVKRTLENELLILFIAFLCMLVTLRYFGGILFEDLLSFIFPFILIITAWLCFYLVKIKWYIGYSIIIIIMLCITSIATYIKTITNMNPSTFQEAYSIREMLIEQYPQKKFIIYDYQRENDSISKSLSLLLDTESKTNENGMKIGIAYYGAPVMHQQVDTHGLDLQIYNLDTSNDQQLAHDGFIKYTPFAIYHSVEEWYQ